jgi:hypothetical protein
MIRYFLAQGDRAGSAVITQGLPSVTCSNPPPAVQIATLYMKTYCAACKREGFIAPRGPRRPGTGPNGKPWALSGDVNICDCNPPPIFHAERGMKMVFTAQELDKLMRRGESGEQASAATATASKVYDEQAQLVSAPIAGVPYYIETADGQKFFGRTGANGLLPRIDTDAEAHYTVHWGDEALARAGMA